MAIKTLKTIKFPELPDTYTIPQVDSVPTQGSNNAVRSGGVYESINEINGDINDLKSGLSNLENELVDTTSYQLSAGESATIPANVAEQHVAITIEPERLPAKTVTNAATSFALPGTYVSTNRKHWLVFNKDGTVEHSDGYNIGTLGNITGTAFVWVHISEVFGDGLAYFSANPHYLENGGARSGNITTPGWYATRATGSITYGLTYNADGRGATIDKFVAVDSAELEELYPETTWTIDSFIANFPATTYGNLDFGETSQGEIINAGTVVVTHDGTSTTYHETTTVTLHPGDTVAVTSGSASFGVSTPINFVKTVNGSYPDDNGNVSVDTVKSVNNTFPDSDGNVDLGIGDSYIAAFVRQKKPELTLKGTATDLEITSLEPEKYDAYIYKTDKVHGLYKTIALDGDILWWNGSEWETLSFNPGTFDLYENERHYDVVIVGGGAGGIGAAYALKDSGYTVCIVESLDTLGGTHTNAGVIQMLSSPAPDFLKTIIGDLVTNGYAVASNTKSYGSVSESAFDKAWRGGYITPDGGRGTTYSVNPWAISKRYYDDLVDAGIDVLLGCDFTSVSGDDGVVEYITVKNRHDGLTERIWGFYFIDASSFASLCTYEKTQGTDYYTGTDSQARFNESAISNDYVADVKQVNSAEADYMLETVIGATFDAPLCKSTDAFAARQGLWSIPNTIGKTIKILSTDGSDRCGRYIFNPSYGKDYAYAVDQSKNRTKDHFKKYFGATSENRYIKSMPLIAMRETNRIVCDEMLVQDDITILATSQNYATNHYVALASWNWDLHNKTGVNTADLPTSARLCGLPYEAIIPTAYKNVLVASKCFGASHIASSYFRLTKTCMSIGWAAGNAVKIAVGAGYIDDVRNVDIDALQSAIGIGDMLTDIETYFDFA